MRRVQACSASSAARYWLALTLRPSSVIAQLSESMSAAAERASDGRPRTARSRALATRRSPRSRRCRSRVVEGCGMRDLDVVAEAREQAAGRSRRRPCSRRGPARSGLVGRRPMRKPAARRADLLDVRSAAAARRRRDRRASDPRPHRADAAASRIERVTASSKARPAHISPISGPIETRPRDGLRPTRPHSLAGMRIEPPPSLACAAPTMRAATAAAAPPLDPPLECAGFHGLRVGP